VPTIPLPSPLPSVAAPVLAGASRPITQPAQ
jgi:hypothetical protein